VLLGQHIGGAVGGNLLLPGNGDSNLFIRAIYLFGGYSASVSSRVLRIEDSALVSGHTLWYTQIVEKTFPQAERSSIMNNTPSIMLCTVSAGSLVLLY
jgi:hypothetical protein